MIVWSGRGILPVLVFVLAMFICVAVLPSSYGLYGFVVSLFVAGIFSYFFGLKWNYKISKIFIDKETGREVVLVNNHGLFWIKMQYWGIIFVFLGIVILCQNLHKGGIELLLNIFLGIVGLICLVVFGLKLSRINSVNKATIEEVKIVEIPKFEKEVMKNFESNEEDYNKYMPK